MRRLFRLLDGVKNSVHRFFAGKLAHLFISGLHLLDERVPIGRRDVHALCLQFFDYIGFTVGDFFARQVLGFDSFLFKYFSIFFRQVIEKSLVREEHLTIEIVIRERKLVLRFEERIGKNCENRILFRIDHTLLQGRVELRIGNLLCVGADRIKRSQ